jgi:F0F1-type ATP synthase delta subunit
MTKNQIKKIAEKSFTNKNLNEAVVKGVAKRLKRSELKLYLKELYALENKKTVKVYLPTDNQENLKELYSIFKKIYPDKKIAIGVDTSLILGIRVENEDDIYELSLKNVFGNLIEHVGQAYDR